MVVLEDRVSISWNNIIEISMEIENLAYKEVEEPAVLYTTIMQSVYYVMESNADFLANVLKEDTPAKEIIKKARSERADAALAPWEKTEAHCQNCEGETLLETVFIIGHNTERCKARRKLKASDIQNLLETTLERRKRRECLSKLMVVLEDRVSISWNNIIEISKEIEKLAYKEAKLSAKTYTTIMQSVYYVMESNADFLANVLKKDTPAKEILKKARSERIDAALAPWEKTEAHCQNCEGEALLETVFIIRCNTERCKLTCSDCGISWYGSSSSLHSLTPGTGQPVVDPISSVTEKFHVWERKRKNTERLAWDS